MRRFLILGLLLLVPLNASAQGGHFATFVIDSKGHPVPAPSISVCSPGSSGVPCSPQAQIFSDITLTQAITQPFLGDQLGNFDFYASPGRYDVQISGTGIATYVLKDTILSPDFTGKSTVLSGGGGGGSNSSGCVLGGVSILTGDYTVQATDSGKLLVFNSSGPATVTLLNPPSSDKWCVELQDVGAGTLTINPSGLTIDVVNSTGTLTQNGGIRLYTDGANYFSARSPDHAGFAKLFTTSYTAQGLDNGSLLSFNSASPATLTLPSTAPAANWWISVQDVGAGALTIAPNGLTLDTSSSSLVLQQNQGIIIFQYAGNYLSSRGVGTSAAQSRRVCTMVIGADNAASVLVDADLGPQRNQCNIPYASTVVEITENADAGVPSVIVQKRHCSTYVAGVCTVWVDTDLLSSALAAHTGGFDACSNAGGTTGLDGGTTCSATLQNTSIAQGDWLQLKSGTAGGTAKRSTTVVKMSIP